MELSLDIQAVVAGDHHGQGILHELQREKFW